MTLEQLRIFVAVAERQHMTRAAEALNMTQSAASAGVAALEARHGVRLFDRVGRGVALSEAGRVFLPEARAVLARAEAAAQALDDLAGLRRGAIALAASQTVANHWLPSRMARFAVAHPGIIMALTVGNTTQVADAVLEGRADLGFVEGDVDAPFLERAPMAIDRISLYAVPDHPLAGRKVGLADLEAVLWVLREPGSGTRSEFEHALDQRGLDSQRLRTLLELPSNAAVLDAVLAGGLVTAVSDLAALPLVAAGRLVRLAFDLPARRFDLITHRDRMRSHAAMAFIAEIGAQSDR